MKLGLEIHQRLDTHKLFCSCPSQLAEDVPPDAMIMRRLHPVFSELGEVDKAAVQEFKKDKTYEYSIFKKNNCLVETDEEPPHEINKEALAIVLEVAFHLNAKPVDEIHVMRKLVIDGSNTSGFQRTTIIAVNGYLETNKGKVGIPQIALEEESAGIIEGTEKVAKYRLDRLGIPLIEISTDPDIKDGVHLQEVAEKIGMILRATGKVARGLGTIRQDVNVSIEGGTRVEIKGAQDLKMLPTLVENEVARQKALLLLYKNIKKITPSITNLTSLFSKTDAKLIKTGLERNHQVVGCKLSLMKGMIGKEINPNRRFGTELSDYAKMAGVKGIIHSDEDLAKYGMKNEEIETIRKTLNIADSDAFIMVVAEEKIATQALDYALLRINAPAVLGETRRANPDGTSSYMRPIPGKARLYPETDIPSFVLDATFLKNTKKQMGESLEEKKEKLKKLLNPEMAEKILKSKNLKLFESLVEDGNDPTLVATTLENTLVSLRREGIEIKETDRVLAELFSEYLKGSFVKAAIPEILKLISKGKTIEKALDEGNLHKLITKELEKIAKENNYEVAKIMQQYRLCVDPGDLAKLKKK